jgi:hypothetical protein
MHESRISPEAKAVLEAHLDVERDPSLAIRSVYGEYFPWLYVYDPAWALGLVDRLFPLGDPPAAYTSHDRDAVAHADRIIDHLTKLGLEQYRSSPQPT